MFDYMFGNKDYPYEALYIERTKPLTVDGEYTYEGAIPFMYRKVRKTVSKTENINGLKEIKYDTVIRTKSNFPFKARDMIRIGNETYTVKTALKVENDMYKEAKIIYRHFDDYETEIELE